MPRPVRFPNIIVFSCSLASPPVSATQSLASKSQPRLPARLHWKDYRSQSAMAGIGRNMIAPLLVLNLIMYIIVIGFASWNLNHFINGQTNYPGVGGNGATFYFLVFAMLAGVVGAASKLAGIHHVRSWRGDSLATNAATSLTAWAITALAFGVACKEIHIGGHRGWRLRVLEAFVIILAFTQLLYVLMLHAGLFNDQFPHHSAAAHHHHAGGYPADYAAEPKGTARV